MLGQMTTRLGSLCRTEQDATAGISQSTRHRHRRRGRGQWNRDGGLLVDSSSPRLSPRSNYLSWREPSEPRTQRPKTLQHTSDMADAMPRHAHAHAITMTPRRGFCMLTTSQRHVYMLLSLHSSSPPVLLCGSFSSPHLDPIQPTGSSISAGTPRTTTQSSKRGETYVLCRVVGHGVLCTALIR
jgi:hypothetical protein